MKCQNCGEYDANVEYTQIVNGEKLHLHLCSRCANDMNIGLNFDFGINDIFSSFFGEMPELKVLPKENILKCDVCGTSYEEFINEGKLGCPNCYIVFEEKLDDVLKRFHGANKHIERRKTHTLNNIKKENKKLTSKEKKEILKKELADCIRVEDYEKAAVIRDKIKKLEREIEK